ncbi:rhamnan synthesis F family protein [Kaistia terrae]|uniref:Rhamnan synthesis F family protein n=1 Tax=Kaistia terrae TaxID=537017 RepID=A0ABW0PUW1_9HYPH|nr:rhamnan synthesis F family protein [Kaistia terrae]MCX5577040.1 rhamnan synthesis F [Kaistia terrae]
MRGVERGAALSVIHVDTPGRYIVEVVLKDRRMPFIRMNVCLGAHPDRVIFVPCARRTIYLLESTERGLVLQLDGRDVLTASIRPWRISDLGAILRQRRRQKRFQLSLLDQSPGHRVVLRPLLYSSGSDGRELATALRGVASWGFGPASDNLQKTLARYFDGPPILAPERAPTAEPKIAVALHLHYAELWPEFEALLEAIERPFQLILTLTHPNPALAERVRATFPGSEVLVYDNRGRDVGPFVQLLREGRLDGFDLICKLHGKKSGMSGSRMVLGEIWRLASVFDLIGSRDVVDRIVAEFDRSPDIGMIGSRRFQLPNEWKDEAAAWSVNKAMTLDLLATMGIASNRLSYFAGTMFWVRRSALEPLRRLNLSLASFPDEEGQQDGTLQHALERVFGMICPKIKGVGWDDDVEMDPQKPTNSSDRVSGSGHLERGARPSAGGAPNVSS